MDAWLAHLPQALFLLILVGSLVLFAHPRVRVDVAAMLVLLALTVTGLLDAHQALSGFASEPAIIIAAVFVISAGLSATGVTEHVGQWIGRAAGRGESRVIAVTMPTVAALASFTHQMLVTAMMVPLLTRLARTHNLPVSRLLMPMSLAASLGTTLTLVSAPAFLLASDLLRRAGQPALSLFSISPIGIALVLVGTVFMLAARWLLPRRSGVHDDDSYLRLDNYRTELRIIEGGPWATRTFAELQRALPGPLRLVGWLRQGQRRDDLGPHSPLLGNDVLVIEASADALRSLHDDPGLDLEALLRFGAADTLGEGAELVQAVVAPGSEFIGRSLRELDFARRFDASIVALWRREAINETRLADIHLREGDVLVLWGDAPRFTELSSQHGFLLLVPFTGEARRSRHAPLALAILAGSVLFAAAGWLTPPLAFLLGAVAMVVTRCVDIAQAYRAIDVRIFVMLAGVIPLGIAMEHTGTAALLADLLLRGVDGWSPLAILLLLFAAAALLTQVLSDSATTVLLAPVAISLAEAIHLPPTPFVVCTALGAVTAFLTPIGHHGNLLILRPGQYRFVDFFRIGLPLTTLLALISAWLARWLWLGGPLLPA